MRNSISKGKVSMTGNVDCTGDITASMLRDDLGQKELILEGLVDALVRRCGPCCDKLTNWEASELSLTAGC